MCIGNSLSHRSAVSRAQFSRFATTSLELMYSWPAVIMHGRCQTFYCYQHIQRCCFFRYIMLLASRESIPREWCTLRHRNFTVSALAYIHLYKFVFRMQSRWYIGPMYELTACFRPSSRPPKWEAGRKETEGVERRKFLSLDLGDGDAPLPPPVWRPRLPAKTSFLTCYKRRLSRHSICNVIRRTHQYVDEKMSFLNGSHHACRVAKYKFEIILHARTWASYSYSQYGYNSCV